MSVKMRTFEITVASLEIKVNGSYATYTIQAPTYQLALDKIPHKEFCVKEYGEIIK